MPHRYYSETSNPTMDLDEEGRKLLTSRQALADAAHFMDYFRDEVGAFLFLCIYIQPF